MGVNPAAADVVLAPEERQTKRRIPWYRTRLDRQLLAELNRRSDLLGLAQTLGLSSYSG